MNDGSKLPAGHISVEDAIKLIEKHTTKKPLVDLEFLKNNIKFMNSAHNYTIKLMQQDVGGKYYSGMHVAAVVRTDRDLENLKFAIKEAYKKATGRLVEPEKEVRAITTQVNDKAGSSSKLRVNKDSKAAFGAKIESGNITVETADEVNNGQK